MSRITTLSLVAAAMLLAACDQLGIESASALSSRREAEGKAVGGGCRLSARSLEVCYTTNKRADKAAVFAGWREMNDYMRENKIDAMPPPPEPPQAAADGDEGEGTEQAAKDGGKPGKVKTVAKAH